MSLLDLAEMALHYGLTGAKVTADAEAGLLRRSQVDAEEN